MNCEGCNGKFTDFARKQRFCSPSCRDKFKNLQKQKEWSEYKEKKRTISINRLFYKDTFRDYVPKRFKVCRG